MYIIYAILAFSLLIIVHELGHFIMAKVNGVKVEEFSIGMGPKIISVTKNETKYSIGILPIGGYVKMLGEERFEEDEEKEDNKNQNLEYTEGSLQSKSPFRRLTIILAGVIMNVILSIVLFAAISNHSGFAVPVIDEVLKGSAVSGVLKPGDEFVSVDNRKVITPNDVIFGLATDKDETISLTVKRNGEEKSFEVKPNIDKESGLKKIGVSFKYVKEPSIMESIKQGCVESISTIKQTYSSLKMLVTGKANFKTDVGGPVSIIKMTGYAAKNGFWTLMNFTAFISINLAVLNLLPLPALDGGWALMILFELITGKKVPEKVTNAINSVGFIVLMAFMLIVTIKDILFPIAL